MAGAKEIRNQIKSIGSTRKITKAMEMVAASKMRRAKDRMTAARPYAAKMRTVVAHLAHAHPEYKHPYLMEREPRAVGFIIVSSDRGLCGGLNVNVFRRVVSAMSDWRDKGGGLEAGGDDYPTKPFHMEELLARLKVLIRRAAGFASSVIEHGPLRLDTSSKEVRVEGALVELTAFEYRLLEFLALNPSRVVSKTELTEHLYEQDFDRDSNVIEVFIGRLRRKLDPAGSLKPIRTVRGQGYRFALALDLGS